MRKLLEKMANIPTDKLLHFLWGCVVAFVANYFIKNHAMAWYVVLGVAIAKEIYDKRDGRLFDWYDIFFTILPASMIIILLNK